MTKPLFLIFFCLHLAGFAQPTPVMQTYFGGEQEDSAASCSFLSNGDFVSSGLTTSITQIQFGNSNQNTQAGGIDNYLNYFQSDGTLLWSTYIGGNEYEDRPSIYVTQNSDIIVYFRTTSTNLTTTSNAYRHTLQGDDDGFIQIYSNQGDLIYSSYFGGEGLDIIAGLYEDENGDIIICGYTNSPNLGTAGALQEELTSADAIFFAKLQLNGGLSYFSYFNEIVTGFIQQAVPYPNGDFCIFGSSTQTENLVTPNAFISENTVGASNIIGRFSPTGEKIWLSYFGDGNQRFNEMTLDNSENIYIVGRANIGSTIATNGAFSTEIIGQNDPFIFKINSSYQPEWCTYFGGQEIFWDDLNGVDVDTNGTVFLAGYVRGVDDLSTPNAFQPFITSTDQNEAILVEFNSAGNLLYCTYFGASNSDVFNDIKIKNNNLLIVGKTANSQGLQPTNDLDTNYGGGISDAYITKWDIELLHEEIEKQAIQVYPNPSIDGRFQLNRAIRLNKIEAFDLQGRLVYSDLPYPQGTPAINLPLPTGLYTLQLTHDNEEKWVTRVSIVRD